MPPYLSSSTFTSAATSFAPSLLSNHSTRRVPLPSRRRADHAWEATAALKEFLGEHYVSTEENMFVSLWKNYKTCRVSGPECTLRAGFLSRVADPSFAPVSLHTSLPTPIASPTRPLISSSRMRARSSSTRITSAALRAKSSTPTSPPTLASTSTRCPLSS